MRLLGFYINLLFEIGFKDLFINIVNYKNIVLKH